ncbi:MAG: HIRAN domain-containing protein [Methanobacteriaceae archaeon]|nr:HIRAN domain-containing protein [Methanobacteriaceae archaeon]
MTYNQNLDEPIFSIQTRVAGAYYYFFNKIGYEAVEEWTFVRLEREPTNPYDDYAVKVLLDGELMGYVPRGLSSIISNIIKNNEFQLKSFIKLENSENNSHKRSDWDFVLIIHAYKD